MVAVIAFYSFCLLFLAVLIYRHRPNHIAPGWRMTDYGHSVHVLPIDDEATHRVNPEGDCFCKPRVCLNDPKTFQAYRCPLVIHFAEDCRELLEEAEVIKNLQ